jgi:Cytochrome C oxidase, cbb3-type, subunit III
MRTLAILSLAMVSAAALPARGDPALLGDPAHGAALFRSYCAGCHGADGRAQGELSAHPAQRPESLRAASVLATNTDAELIDFIVKGDPGGMPSFPHFPALDSWDVIAFLRQGEIRITDFFPSAAFFTAKAYTLDPDAKKRVADAIGHDLSGAEATMPVMTFYGHADGAAGPQRVGDDPADLDKLKPKDKDGYLLFLELPRGDGKGETSYGVSLAKDGHILRIASPAGVDKAYLPFVGLGHKGQDILLKPKGKKIPPRIEEAFGPAFVRALEAVTMFDKDERDRHWADTN